MTSRFLNSVALLTSLTLFACAPPKPSTPKEAEKAIAPFAPPQKSNVPEVTTDLERSIFDDADGLSLAAKEKCAEDVCGSPPNEPAPDAVTSVAANQLMEKLRPKIESALSNGVASDTAIIDKILSLKKEILQVKPDLHHMAFANFLWALSFSEKISKAWDPNAHKYDHAKAVKLLPEIPATDVKQIELMLAAFRSADDMTVANSISEEGLMVYFSRQTKSNDLLIIRAAAKSYAQSIRSRIGGVKSNFPTLPITVDPATVALANGADLDSAETERFVSDIGSASFDGIYGKNVDLYMHVESKIADQLNSFLSVSLPILEKNLSSDATATEATKTLAACERATMNLARLKVNEGRVMLNAKPMIDIVRAQALKTAEEFTSDESLRIALRQKIAEVQFASPVSTEQIFKKIELDLDDKTSSSLAELAIVKNVTLQDLALFVGAGNLSAMDNTRSMADVCDHRDPDSLVDHSVSSMGFISLSWPTLANPSAGYGVIAHEFGHIVSAALASVKAANKNNDPTIYTNVYDCVQSRQVGKNSISTQEEDFADLFAAHVLRDLEASRAAPANFVCLLMKQRSVGRFDSSSGLAMRWPSDNEYDHSPDFYRLIQNEIDRRHPLSSTCKGLVQQSYPSMTNQCRF